VADQNRSLVALVRQSLQQADRVGDHVVEPVAATGRDVEARGLAVAAGVGSDDAVVVTPAAYRVGPAQA